MVSLPPFFCSLSLPFFFPLGPVVPWSSGLLVSWPRLGLLLWSAQFFLPVGPLLWSLLCLVLSFRGCLGPPVFWAPWSLATPIPVRPKGIK